MYITRMLPWERLPIELATNFGRTADHKFPFRLSFARAASLTASESRRPRVPRYSSSKTERVPDENYPPRFEGNATAHIIIAPQAGLIQRCV